MKVHSLKVICQIICHFHPEDYRWQFEGGRSIPVISNKLILPDNINEFVHANVEDKQLSYIGGNCKFHFSNRSKNITDCHIYKNVLNTLKNA